ncbi:MAG: CDP-glycerol glycerophosphotransferase family protein [Eubacteriales bacterium]|nr:CDP-glycerol glycerophosphotransferase family protein [Eubacteriales bacterium]
MINILKAVYSVMLRILLFPMRIFPVHPRRIIFTALTGGNTYEYSCNLKYICEYLLDNLPGEFEILWVVAQPRKYEKEKKRGIRFLQHYRLRSFYYLLTAKVVVTSGAYAPWFPFRKNQYVINTWHGGGAYKRLRDDLPGAGWLERRRTKFCAENIDLFLSSCRMATEKLFRGAFHYCGEIMEAGMPRNDCLVNGQTEAGRKKVQSYFKIPEGDRIVLYAPTYRSPQKTVTLDGGRLLKLLEESENSSISCGKGGEERRGRWHLLFRAHRYQEGMEGIRVEGDYQDAGDYPDMQELLCAADMLITDYSSVVWDYSFLFRPCFLYVPDLQEYTEKTGFYVDIHDWPFPTAGSWEELKKEIEEYDAKKAKEQIREHHRRMGSLESGHACERAAERIAAVCAQKDCHKTCPVSDR